jgi:hypothetical protein
MRSCLRERIAVIPLSSHTLGASVDKRNRRLNLHFAAFVILQQIMLSNSTPLNDEVYLSLVSIPACH